MKTYPILTGQSFGKWRVIAIAKDKKGRPYWLCQCDCGSPPRDVGHHNLTYGISKSCGCSKRRHGHCLMGKPSPTMSSYQAMLGRCTQPSSPAFEHYKRRGITMCERWLSGNGQLNGFECFFADMGARPSILFSIERVDNDKGYDPSNCRWATHREQARNRTTTNFHEYQGGMVTLRELSEKTNIPYEMLRHRIARRGLPVETAVNMGPKRQYRRPK